MPFPKIKSHELASCFNCEALLLVQSRCFPMTISRNHDASKSQIDRSSSQAHSSPGVLLATIRELPRWKRDHGLLH